MTPAAALHIRLSVYESNISISTDSPCGVRDERRRTVVGLVSRRRGLLPDHSAGAGGGGGGGGAGRVGAGPYHGSRKNPACPAGAAQVRPAGRAAACPLSIECRLSCDSNGFLSAPVKARLSGLRFGWLHLVFGFIAGGFNRLA